MLKRVLWLSVLAMAVAAVVVGCGGKAEKPVVTITDNEGKLAPRVITVEYVNERIDHMPPNLMPDVPGDEGKRQFIDEIIKKELLVIDGYRLGLVDDPQYEQMRQLYSDDKAYQMFIQEMLFTPAEPTDEDVARHAVLRETKLTLQQIVVNDEITANDAYHRIVDGGEDFGEVAKEVSVAHSAADGGKMEPKLWADYHPLVTMAITDLDVGGVTKPIDVGGAWHIYKVLGRSEPKQLPEYDEAKMNSIRAECRTWKRTVQEQVLNDRMMDEAKLEYNDAAMDILSRQMTVKIEEMIPENVDELPVEQRMELARQPMIPDFTDEEAAMQLVSYRVGGKEHTWTLGDVRDLIQSIPGIEGPKTDDVYGLKLFLWRKIRDELIKDEIARKKYKDTKELKDYVDQKLEEYLVNATYMRDVNDKIEEPTGQEVREYFQSHREDYAEPPKVDLRQLVVETEAEANLYRQMLTSGKATFEELVQKYSIEPWSKSRDGLIDNYYQGERKLDYLQGVVFDLPVGEISKPFPAPPGFAIVEVLKKYPARDREFSELGDAVKNDMMTLRREARLNALLDEIRETVTVTWDEANLALVKDTAEAKKEKEAAKTTVVTS